MFNIIGYLKYVKSNYGNSNLKALLELFTYLNI